MKQNTTTQQKVEIMLAHLEGKVIQIKQFNHDWKDLTKSEPVWEWGHAEYRIKPPPVYPNLATEEELEAIELLGLIIKSKKKTEDNNIYRLNYLRLLPNGSNTPKDLKDNYFVFNPETKCWEDWSKK